MTIFSTREIRCVPRWLAQDHADPMVRRLRDVAVFDSLWDFCERRKPASVCLYRTHALGDILMLLPIVRQFRRALSLPEPVLIIVAARYLEQISGLNRTQADFRLAPKRGIADYGADVHFDLNDCLEADHHGGPESSAHRMELYGRAMGMEVVRA